MLAQKLEAFGEAGEHAERQHIDLEHAERFDVVLVPGDDGAVLHRGVLDGHKFVEPAARNEKATRMLRKMARKADQLAGQFQAKREPAVARIEAEVREFGRRDALFAPAPDRARERGCNVRRKPKRLAHFA